MRAINLWSYNENSEGAKALSNLTGFKRIKHKGSKYKPGPDKLIINWGDSINFPRAYLQSQVLNNPAVVGAITNKLKFFEHMHEECRCPEFTTNCGLALGWINADKNAIVVCRKVLTGHSGDGIILYSRVNMTNNERIPQVPLYTRYVPKKTEFRVHFFKDKVIDVQEKRKRKDFEGEANFKVRNHQNGFVYCREDVEVPRDVAVQAQLVINKCGLDFGAIDIIYNAKQGLAYVLEVNTAPGLEGTSVESYAKAIKEYVNGR